MLGDLQNRTGRATYSVVWLSSRIKGSIRKSGGGFLALANLVSFVTSRLLVDVRFLPKCVRAPSGDGGRFLGLAACGSDPAADQLLRRRWGRRLNCSRRTP
jgi:hypothetical protein